ncbi:MAG: hypothetical protein JNK60_12370 [Acidobacteria bacterium]|nr:hypothetical protein [Acidobacteriota bacterium]
MNRRATTCDGFDTQVAGLDRLFEDRSMLRAGDFLLYVLGDDELETRDRSAKVETPDVEEVDQHVGVGDDDAPPRH